MTSTNAAQLAAYTAALSTLDLPQTLTWTVTLAPRRRSIGAAVVGAEVVFKVPPVCTVQQFTDAVQRMRGRLLTTTRKARETGPNIVTKELVNGESFPFVGRNQRLCLVQDGDHLPRSHSQRPLTAHPGVRIIAEDGPSTWSGVRTYQLTMRRDAASARTVIDWYRAEGKRWLDEHVPALAQRLGVRPGLKWRVRPYRPGSTLGGSWATYSRQTHTIAVDWVLFQFPRELVHYVAAHEVAHAATPRRRGEGSHGPSWEANVGRLVPNWRDLDRKAKTADGLTLWLGTVATRPAPAIPPPAPAVSSWAQLLDPANA